MIYDKKFSEKAISNVFGRLLRIRKRLLNELHLNKNDTVLDIGCNKGELVEFLSPFCKKIYGIDINRDAIGSSNVPNLKYMDCQKMTFADNYFSKIVSSMTIEHIPDIKKAFSEIERLLKKDGIAVLHYPWELVRGMSNAKSSLLIHKNPFMGYKYHLHRLNHKRIGKIIKDTHLRIIRKSFIFDPWPGYITVLQKI